MHLVIYNLITKQSILDKDKPENERHHGFFRWKDDICAFIDDYWDYLLPGKKRKYSSSSLCSMSFLAYSLYRYIGSATWHNTIASVLSTHGNLFRSGFEVFKQSGKIGN